MPDSRSSAQALARHEVGDDGLLLARDDGGDELVDELVARVERVVEARERHAGLGDDRARRRLGDAVPRHHAQGRLDERGAALGCGDAGHAAPLDSVAD